MANAAEAMQLLIPTGGYVLTGETFEDIQFIEATPITKAQFLAGFQAYDTWKAEQDAAKAKHDASIIAKLAALGLTLDDLKGVLA